MSDAATLACYQAQAPQLALSSAQAPSRHLDGFLDLLRPNDHVLELGCGTGRDAARIAERGFGLDTTDAVPAMAREVTTGLTRLIANNPCDMSYDDVVSLYENVL